MSPQRDDKPQTLPNPDRERKYREALEEIAGGFIPDTIGEEDWASFVVALQNIARAALSIGEGGKTED